MLLSLPAHASPWDSFIRRTEKIYKLPQRLLSAIIEFESHFQSDATNYQKPGVAVTSHGLGQLTIDTAITHCQMLLADLYVPFKNISCSAKVLRYQMDRFASMDYAIAAYNSGTPCVCDGSFYRYEGWHDGEVCRRPRSKRAFACFPTEKGRFLNQTYVDGVKDLM